MIINSLYGSLHRRASITAWSQIWKRKVDFILIPYTRSCSLYTELIQSRTLHCRPALYTRVWRTKGGVKSLALGVFLSHWQTLWSWRPVGDYAPPTCCSELYLPGHGHCRFLESDYTFISLIGRPLTCLNVTSAWLVNIDTCSSYIFHNMCDFSASDHSLMVLYM